MKLIVTVVRPERLTAVKEALFRVGVTGMTLSRASGHGGEQEIVEHYRGSVRRARVPREGAHRDGGVGAVRAADDRGDLDAARTGDVGDGKIFVQPLDHVIRIRTGEEDRAALTPVTADEVQSPTHQLIQEHWYERTSTISAATPHGCSSSTALVLLMVPGLALFYGGLVRTRAVLNTFMMSVGRARRRHRAVGARRLLARVRAGRDHRRSAVWVGLLGVGAAAGPYSATIPHLAFVGFQAMFAGITVALISGAMVERIRFHVYLVFALLWTTFVYDPLAHWVWATDGWLHKLGALDFAGGTVVHISAGTAALVAAAMLGRRRDFGRTPLRPHNVVFTLTGAASALGRLARLQRRIRARRRRRCRARAREVARGRGGGARWRG